MSDIRKTTYEKLTPQRKILVDQVLNNLEKGTGLWTQGWSNSGVPVSAITGKAYRGVNNVFLTLVSMREGYTDNRWLTYKQMTDKGWTFKTDAEGKSLGKGKGVSVEFFEIRDRLTKQPFSKSSIAHLEPDERYDYIKENVYTIRRFHYVFNGSLVEGIPEKEKKTIDPKDRVERADNIIQYWSEHEAKIRYGGDEAYYRLRTDSIQLPLESDFVDMQEFYSTALHEIGHSTGHPSRLNRDMSGRFGTPEYALEELRAEIASMFISQDLDIHVDQNHIQNNSAYISSWKERIKDNPNVLFTAISDANKIARFVMSKEHQEELEVEEEPSEIFILPSLVAEGNEDIKPVDMIGRGIDSLSRMADKDIIDKASSTKEKEKFEELYNGKNLYGTKEQNETSLMRRLAVYCGNDKEQLLRVFKSSGQFREDTPISTYEKMAEESISFVINVKGNLKPIVSQSSKSNSNTSAKA